MVAITVSVVVPRLVGVVVGGCGGTDLLLEPGEGDPVDADIAVHPDVTLDGLLVPLEEEIRDELVRAEVARVRDLDSFFTGREACALLADALLENPGEEEVGEDGDLLRAELLEALKAGSDVREGQADEGGLHRRVRAALVEQAGDLGEGGGGVGVRGAATDYQDSGLLFFLLGDDGGDT